MSLALAAAAACAPLRALAQRSAESATAGAEDAFGGAVGQETVGIYTDIDVRGFNPQKAGNTRLDEVYFDQIATMAHRARASYSIRVGLAAMSDPSPAPSGILAMRLHQAGDELRATVGVNVTQYGGRNFEIDTEVPIVEGRLATAAGVGLGNPHYSDGAATRNRAFGLVPVLRLGDVEIKPVVSGFLSRADTRPLITVAGPFLPPLVAQGRYLGQTWARNRSGNYNNGVLARAQVTPNLLVRGGFMQSRVDRKRNFTELFAVRDAGGLSRHRLLADPKQSSYSNSWELFAAYRFGDGALRHTVHADIRSRRRHMESGGSQIFDFGDVVLGERDREPKPIFAFDAVNVGTLEQRNYSLGYRAAYKAIGQVNIGVTRSDYSARTRTALGVSRSAADPWLYNASIVVRPTPSMVVFGGYVSGLEDTGQAPENALNRNQQLPASRTSQIEAGLQQSIGHMRLVVTAFQMKKPYFSFDSASRFIELGDLSHRGVELSATGSVTPRLHVVAGAIVMEPKVSGTARDQGLVGPWPVGTPRLHARLDATYRADILGGVTFTLGLFRDSRRAASTIGYAQLGGRQLFVPGRTTVDIGARRNFKVGGTPMSIRFVVNNIFDERSWKVISSNTFQLEDSRRFNLYLLADF